MTDRPISEWGPLLLSAANAACHARQTLEDLQTDSGLTLDDDELEAIARDKADEEAAMAYLEANAPKCPGCAQAFAFQRQPRHPNRCSWCGYDHETGGMPSLVPA